MNDDKYKVRIESNGVVYRGRCSVHQDGTCVYIDGKRVGVEVDNDGNSLTIPLPGEHLKRTPWWIRLWRWITGAKL